MAMILLDAGLVGLACSHPSLPAVIRFEGWMASAIGTRTPLIIADVTRYEVRRELARLGASVKLARLGRLCERLRSARIDEKVWDRAADLWADVRRRGRPTAGDDDLDADAILAAIAMGLAGSGESVIVATTNVKHLTWLGVDARLYTDI